MANSIGQTLVQIGPDFILIATQIVKLVLVDKCLCIYDELLEKPLEGKGKQSPVGPREEKVSEILPE